MGLQPFAVKLRAVAGWLEYTHCNDIVISSNNEIMPNLWPALLGDEFGPCYFVQVAVVHACWIQPWVGIHQIYWGIRMQCIIVDTLWLLSVCNVGCQPASYTCGPAGWTRPG